MILIADSSALIALAHCDCLEILEGLLGSGEMEAMALYKKLNADWLLIDDEKARKTARFNKIKVIGSLGVLLLAITWNCNGAFRNKFSNIIKLGADIYVIQECENPKESLHKEYIEWANNYLWIGDKKHKGVGIFANEKVELRQLKWSNNFKDHSVKYFLPCLINNSFQLLAIWTHQIK